MKHVVFFLSVVAAGIIIAAGSYVYSSSATWKGHGAGHGMPFEWFKQLATFENPGAAPTPHKQPVPQKNFQLKNSKFDLGDLYTGLEKDYFYPKLYAPVGTVPKQQFLSSEYVTEYAHEGGAQLASHLVGPGPVDSAKQHPLVKGLAAGKYYQAASTGGSGGGLHGGGGSSQGAPGDSSGKGEGLPLVAELLSFPAELEELSPFIQEEKVDEGEVFNELLDEEQLYIDEESPQPVPEPATWLMIVAGLFLVILNRNKWLVVK